MRYRGVRWNGRGIEIRFQANGARHSRTLHIEPTPQNMEFASRMRMDFIRSAKFSPTDLNYIHGEVSDEYTLRVFVEAKKRAKRKEIPYELTDADVAAVIARAGGKCELTGIPFSASKMEAHMRMPFAPSLDRKDSEQGYTVENCRLVCTAVNLALNEWGEDVFKTIASRYVFSRAF